MSFYGSGSFGGMGGFSKSGGIAELPAEFIEEPDEVTSDSTNETPVLTLPYTPPDPSTDYWVFFSTFYRHSTATINTQRGTIRLRNTTDSTLLTEIIVQGHPSSTTEWTPAYGFAKYTSEETPSEKDFEVSVQATSGITVKLKNTSILIIKAHEDDEYIAAESETTGTGNTYHTKTTLTWTPPAADTPYLVFGYAEIGNNTGTTGAAGRLVHSGTNYGGGFGQYLWDTTTRRPWITMVKLTLPASEQSIVLQFQSTVVTTQTCRRARILALSLNRFPAHYYNEDRTVTTNTDNTYTDPAKTTLTETLTRGNHVIFATDIHRYTTTRVQIESALIIDGSTELEALNNPATVGGNYQYGHTFFMRKKNLNTGSHTIKTDFAGNGTNTVESQQAALAVLKL